MHFHTLANAPVPSLTDLLKLKPGSLGGLSSESQFGAEVEEDSLRQDTNDDEDFLLVLDGRRFDVVDEDDAVPLSALKVPRRRTEEEDE